ncbi:hypothetical protein ACFFQW_34605 [Umezawaea endophytica]|uniref:Fibronectin type-III domain-containing protein n=1 Tax=Umezawaea endophytica TaxID=1654476 RepID=A0A9X2VK69_9PSEU|nr:hypothetical protein [Umezawaea endophytica]MCS7477592.1 hypothetical protein [Umezawaea endophytica]
MADDFDAYRDTVLDAARRAGNVPPSDLLVRYRLEPREVSDPAEFTRQVDAVVKYWRKLKLQKKYLPLATALLSSDTDLRRRDVLNLKAFTEQREQGRGHAKEQLDQRVEVIAASLPCVTVAGLRRLVGALENAFSENEVRDALRAGGVRIVDPPWELAGGAPIPAVRSLRGPLNALGFRLSPEVLFGTEAVRRGFTLRDGFRLAADGRTITVADLEKAREEQSRAKQDERKTAMDNLLAILLNAATQADNLLDLLVWEVREHLRPDIEAGLPAKLVVHTAVGLGLDPTEAADLAVTLTGEDQGRGDGNAGQLAVEALREGELQEARRLLDGLPDGEALDARNQLDEALRRVADLVTQADAAWRDGDQERAAKHLAAAADTAKDDDSLRERLASIPPPPPAEVSAGLDGERVVVRWAPSTATTAGVRYRLVRATGAPAVSSSAGTAVVETLANEAVDDAPPAAEPVHYSVFASRGDTWSAGTSAEAVELLPEVTAAVLEAGERSVTASWRAHPSASDVLVTRVDRADPAATAHPVVVRSGASTFVDDSVAGGGTYDYTFRAVYLNRAGARRVSAPVVATASPTARPVAVTDLDHHVVQERGKPVVRLSWSPPAAGVVEIRSSAAEPPWRVGDVVPAAEVRSFGQPVGGAPVPDGGGRVLLPLPVRQGHLTVTAVTVSGGHAAIGATISLSLVDPVTGVTRERFGDLVRLHWVWPEGAHFVRVRWWPADEGDQPIHVSEVEVSARVHQDTGGTEFVAGRDAVVVTLQTVVRNRGRESVSAAVVDHVAGRLTEVGYAVHQTGLPGRRRLAVTFTSDHECKLPAVVVVHRADGRVPLRVDSGRVVETIPPRPLAAGKPVVVALTERVSPLSGLACFVDPNATHPEEVTLVPDAHR